METSLVKSRADLSLCLEGGNEIDATLLSNIIKDFAELAQHISHEENSEASIKVNITTLRSGSVEVWFQFLSEHLETIETISNIAQNIAQTAAIVVGSVMGCLQVKKHLGGKKAKSETSNGDGTTSFENHNGDVLTAPNNSGVVQKIHVDKLVVNINQNIRAHNPGGGFIVRSGTEESVFDAADVAAMSQEIISKPETKETTSRNDLLIHQMSLLKQTQWRFSVAGSREFRATIEDKEFWASFKNGDFSARPGAYIDATYTTSVELNEYHELKPETTKHTVLKVHGGIKHKGIMEQVKLGDTE